MKKSDVVKAILQEKYLQAPRFTEASAFAPTNIALCKYWGKRNTELNLPVTSSLSIALGQKGARVHFEIIDRDQDHIVLNQAVVASSQGFAQRLTQFLNLFRGDAGPHFSIQIESDIPIAAGLASSACGFASLVMTLNALYGWDLTAQDLSILARLGSGSASRSLWQGFVEWHAGSRVDGMDSYSEPMSAQWQDLRIGLWIMNQQEKPISSRAAMLRTVETSPLYAAWPGKVAKDLQRLKHAIQTQDFTLLGETAESNALNMHATMLSAWPPITYAIPETLIAMQTVWRLRAEGLPLYFTQDAGPNLKLLFLQKESAAVIAAFPEVDVVTVFA